MVATSIKAAANTPAAFTNSPKEMLPSAAR
jgi:hypothetical protein